jgi:hypothetical protein
MQDGLFLHEEVMLLALRDKEGTVAPGTMYQYAIGGAILAELLLNERVAVDESTRRKLVNLVSSEPMGNPLIDQCLERIAVARRRASLQDWVSRFAAMRDLKHRAAFQLCRRGVLRVQEDKILLIFTRKIYPEVDPEPERTLIERLRHAIFSDTSQVHPRTAVLVSLAHSAGLLKVVFDKKQLKPRKARVRKIANGQITGKATKQAIEAMQAAVMVACIMPAVMATAASH